jgi:Bacterial extracellular solute-binding protein
VTETRPDYEERWNALAHISSRAVSTVPFENHQRQTASAVEATVAGHVPPEPLIWPVVTKPQPGIRLFAGHTDTVPDIVGRIGTPPSLVIFTEGNHLMVVLSDDIVGAFPAWAKAQPQYADLPLDNIVVVTLPQPMCIQMIRTGAVALGNLTLDVSRGSGFYPDIFMGYPEPLRQLRGLGVVEPQARFFCKNRGVALLVHKGNPLGIQGLADVTRTNARLALPELGDAPGPGRPAGVRAQCRAAADALLGNAAADALFAAEVPSFPGRLGIMHRDLPEMLARGYADVALTWYHLVSYWAWLFPNHFALIPVPGAEAFFAQIAFGRVSNPLRARAVKAFDEFFFSRAKDVYPRYDFARMNDDEYGASLALG